MNGPTSVTDRPAMFEAGHILYTRGRDRLGHPNMVATIAGMEVARFAMLPTLAVVWLDSPIDARLAGLILASAVDAAEAIGLPL